MRLACPLPSMYVLKGYFKFAWVDLAHTFCVNQSTLLQGLREMHALGRLHGDLRGPNVMITEDGNKVGLFRSIRTYNNVLLPWSMRVTLWHMCNFTIFMKHVEALSSMQPVSHA